MASSRRAWEVIGKPFALDALAAKVRAMLPMKPTLAHR